MIVDRLLAKNKNFSRKELIKELKEARAWVYNPNRKENSGLTPMDKKENQFLIRHYIKPADNMGWTRSTNLKISLTEKGKLALDVYGDKFVCRSTCCDSTVRRRASVRNITMHECLDVMYDHGAGLDLGYTFGKAVEFERKGKKYRFNVSMEEH